MLLADGSLFAGRFRVIEGLAEGGMGEVYRVRDENSNRERALKVLKIQFAANEEFRKRFATEARLSGTFNSRYVVDVFDTGVDEATKLPWLVMELLVGQTLDHQVRFNGPAGRTEAARWFRQLRDALAKAHARGVMHLDLKPSNIFLQDGEVGELPTVKLLDFGIARVLESGKTHMTATTQAGTFAWMAPEQSDAGERLLPATDVWALGLIAFYTLTGRAYWLACNDESSVNQRRLTRESWFDPIAPPSVRAGALGITEPLPEGFDAWFSRCVHRDVPVRFAEAGQCLDALVKMLDAGPSVSVPPGPPLPPLPPIAQPIPTLVQPPARVIQPTVPMQGSPLEFTSPMPTGPDLGAAPARETTPPRPRVGIAAAGALGATLLLSLVGVRMLAPRTWQAWFGRAPESPPVAPPVAPPDATTPAADDRAQRPTTDTGNAPAGGSVPPPPPECPDGSVKIEGGTFTMGSAEGDADERPPFPMTVETFCMDRTEVSVRAWRLCGACGHPARSNALSGDLAVADQPVENVSFWEAARYCELHHGRVPTEPEWEFAARNGGTTRFPWGDTWTDATRANDDGTADGVELLADVTAFPAGASRAGVLNLLGNVAEWTATQQQPYPYGDPRLPIRDAGTRVVFRGGSFLDGPAQVRATNRDALSANQRSEAIGFRCAYGLPR